MWPHGRTLSASGLFCFRTGKGVVWLRVRAHSSSYGSDGESADDADKPCDRVKCELSGRSGRDDYGGGAVPVKEVACSTSGARHGPRYSMTARASFLGVTSGEARAAACVTIGEVAAAVARAL